VISIGRSNTNSKSVSTEFKRSNPLAGIDSKKTRVPRSSCGIPDDSQINDPLSETLASVAAEVNKLREEVHKLEGTQVSNDDSTTPLQHIIEDIDYRI